jgi:hypothetical protein
VSAFWMVMRCCFGAILDDLGVSVAEFGVGGRGGGGPV